MPKWTTVKHFPHKKRFVGATPTPAANYFSFTNGRSPMIFSSIYHWFTGGGAVAEISQETLAVLQQAKASQVAAFDAKKVQQDALKAQEVANGDVDKANSSVSAAEAKARADADAAVEAVKKEFAL